MSTYPYRYIPYAYPYDKTGGGRGRKLHAPGAASNLNKDLLYAACTGQPLMETMGFDPTRLGGDDSMPLSALCTHPRCRAVWSGYHPAGGLVAYPRDYSLGGGFTNAPTKYHAGFGTAYCNDDIVLVRSEPMQISKLAEADLCRRPACASVFALEVRGRQPGKSDRRALPNGTDRRGTRRRVRDKSAAVVAAREHDIYVRKLRTWDTSTLIQEMIANFLRSNLTVRELDAVRAEIDARMPPRRRL